MLIRTAAKHTDRQYAFTGCILSEKSSAKYLLVHDQRHSFNMLTACIVEHVQVSAAYPSDT